MLCGVSVVGIWWGAIRHDIAGVEARLAASERELGRWQNAAAGVDRAAARTQELSNRLAVIARLRRGQRGPSALLSAISESTPEGLWLTEVSRRGSQTRIEGRAASLQAVSDFAERLRIAGSLDAPPEIMVVGAEAENGVPVVRFAIGAKASPPASDAGASRAPAGKRE